VKLQLTDLPTELMGAIAHRLDLQSARTLRAAGTATRRVAEQRMQKLAVPAAQIGAFAESALAGFLEVSTLRVVKTRALNSAGLTQLLAGLPDNGRHIIHLDLSDWRQLNDAGMAYLRHRLPNIQTLNLSACSNISDQGLANIAAMRSLKSLDLSNCDRLTGAGLACLQALTGMTSLNLAHCEGVDDAGLAHLSHLPDLQSLDIRNCQQISGIGLAHLPPKCLKSLVLSGCNRLTDADLKVLTRMPSLDSLTLSLTDNLRETPINSRNIGAVVAS
jgi:ABC-type transporter Mla MlaB component